jgi:hypothetical protein
MLAQTSCSALKNIVDPTLCKISSSGLMYISSPLFCESCFCLCQQRAYTASTLQDYAALNKLFIKIMQKYIKGLKSS